MGKFITLTEAAKILGRAEEEVVKIAERGELTAYRIGGNFLRFKLEDIENYKRKKDTPLPEGRGKEVADYFWRERIYDFFYYYDFYIIIILLIIILLIIVFRF
ncbi:MAG: helix-turn-helix domain-containing protein [Candidatus Omnitrophica bacterium]|nr:helix-turn-helix domain-containing protein [Candidatus Omnitrophota bacterium]